MGGWVGPRGVQGIIPNVQIDSYISYVKTVNRTRPCTAYLEDDDIKINVEVIECEDVDGI
jgi:hypothetical protein